MKLQTLKDYFDKYGGRDGWCDENVWVIEEELKQEAIKWIKEDIKLDYGIIARTRTWMKRFNITEEDLK